MIHGVQQRLNLPIKKENLINMPCNFCVEVIGKKWLASKSFIVDCQLSHVLHAGIILISILVIILLLVLWWPHGMKLICILIACENYLYNFNPRTPKEPWIIIVRVVISAKRV